MSYFRRKTTARALLLLGMVALLALAAAAGLGAYWRYGPARPSLPDLTLIDINGKKIPLQAMRGKVLVINFWSTSCAPCLQEMPMWVKTRQSMAGSGLEVIAVAMQMDAPNYVIDFANRQQLPFPVVIDITGEASRAFGGVQVIPTTFLIDREGRIAHKFVGMPKATELQSSLQQLL
jgi:peroxiredoxin